jgi:(hydroxyamino)benzene mutase
MNPTAQLLGKWGAVLLLVGLLTGGYAAWAISGRIPVDAGTALGAHMTAMLGAFFIFAVAWSLPLLRYGPVGQRRLAWAVILPNYANWLITSVKAAFHIKGVDVSAEAGNNLVFAILNVTVVLPILAAAAAWVYGFRSGAADSRS